MGKENDFSISELPRYLKRSLTRKEVYNQCNQVDEKGKSFVVWKCGRTTHHTCGVFSGVWSNYQSPNGIVSDEWLVKDKTLDGDDHFSKSGDSGSFVWNSDGNVIGLLWGGKEQRVVTYFTPMEAVLEDIRQTLGAREVCLMVRPEDSESEKTQEAEKSRTPEKSQALEGKEKREASTYVESVGPSLLDDDDDIGGFAGFGISMFSAGEASKATEEHMQNISNVERPEGNLGPAWRNSFIQDCRQTLYESYSQLLDESLHCLSFSLPRHKVFSRMEFKIDGLSNL